MILIEEIRLRQRRVRNRHYAGCNPYSYLDNRHRREDPDSDGNGGGAHQSVPFQPVSNGVSGNGAAIYEQANSGSDDTRQSNRGRAATIDDLRMRLAELELWTLPFAPTVPTVIESLKALEPCYDLPECGYNFPERHPIRLLENGA